MFLRRASSILQSLALGAAVLVGACSDSSGPKPAAPEKYDITIRFFGAPMTADQQALFTNAAARISTIVTGDLVPVTARDSTGGPLDLTSMCGVQGLPAINEQIDDLVIYAAVQEIDGAGKILAQAGPCLVRTAQYGRLTAVGVMSFDKDDLASLAEGGRLQDVITHEMLHVLGVGTLWTSRDLLVDKGLESVNYTGFEGRSACVQVGGAVPCSTNVPVENTGGSGTRDGHWRESTFDSELMTGFTERGPMPLSIITIGALADLGYTVDRTKADPYTVPTTLALAARASAEPTQSAPTDAAMELRESSLPGHRWGTLPDGAHTLKRAGKDTP